jgi:thiol-disulfide isomerase/thioredoxin
MDCNFCNKVFSTKSSLNNHQKTAKYCLALRNNNILEVTNFYCEYCNKKFTSKQNLNLHLNNCKKKDFQEKEKENVKEKELLEILEEFEKNLKEKEKIIIKINTQIESFEKREIEYKEQIKDLQNKLDRIANKAIDKPTTFTTTNNTINNKFELNTFPSQKEIDRKIESQFNDKYILDGMKGIAQFVYDHIVKLEDGSMAYACFDTSRQIFKYKDENGNEIKDPKAVRLRKMIKPGLLRQSQTLLDYFNDECNYLEKRKDKGHDIDGKEYNMMNTLREKAFEVGCDILSIEETSKFSNELANLSCV